jgi:hypothetical protein
VGHLCVCVNVASPVRPAVSATPHTWQRSIERSGYEPLALPCFRLILACSLQSEQILLGAVAVRYRAAPDIKDLVKDLDDAGTISNALIDTAYVIRVYLACLG